MLFYLLNFPHMRAKRMISALLLTVFVLSSATSIALARNDGNGGNKNNRGGNSSYRGGNSDNQNNSGRKWQSSDGSSNWNNAGNSGQSSDSSNQRGNGNISNNSSGGDSGMQRGNLVGSSQAIINTAQQIQITPRQSRVYHAQILSANDQNHINNRIDNIPLIHRFDFLLSVMWRIETLRASIEASSRNAEAKTRLITLLDAIVDIIQTRINNDMTNSPEADDHTPPMTTSFNVSDITTNSAMISATVDDAWKGFFVVLPSGVAAPNATQVKAWQNGSGQTVATAWSSNIIKGINQFNITGLSPNTGYIVYFAAEDTFENLQTIVANKAFTTLQSWGGGDITPPVTSALSVTGITSTASMVQFTSNEAGTIYEVTLLSGSTAPSTTQVKAWQNASGILADLRGSFAIIAGANQFNLTGLTPSTNYVTYIVAQDSTGNLQGSVMSVPFTTTAIADLTPPVSTLFDIIGIGTGSAMITVSLNESGTGHFVVLQSGATAPTAAQVKAWQDSAGLPVSLHGSSVTNVGVNQFSITGLFADTNYVAYFVAEDMVGNLQSAVTNKSFTTLLPSDTTPPVISALSLTGITNSGAMLQFTSSESGTAYSVVLQSGAIAPSTTQVIAWQNGSGTTADIHATFAITTGSNSSNITGLTSGTGYALYLVTKDTIGNTETSVHNMSFSTTQ